MILGLHGAYEVTGNMIPTNVCLYEGKYIHVSFLNRQNIYKV